MLNGRGQRELSYAVRPRVVLKYAGQLALAIGALSAVPAAVALGLGDTVAAGRYAAMALLTAGMGAVCARIPAPATLQKNEALVVVALTFLLAALVMTYPFAAAGLQVSDAIFEAVSGVTTTGLSTVADIESQPASFLFARAWMQWYGGLGIVAFWLAISTTSGTASKALTGVSHDEDLVGGTIAQSRRGLVVYCILTAVAISLLLVVRVPAFDAVVHTLAAVSTGGFSSHNNSLAGLPNSFGIAIVVLTCVAGAIPTMSYYRAWRRRMSGLWLDRQVWCLASLGAIVTVALVFLMSRNATSTRLGLWGDALTTAFSAQTTAGFSTVDIRGFCPAAKALLIVSMAIGGGAGSTAGGLKLLRLLILLRFVQLMFFRTSLPTHAVSPPRLAGYRLGAEELRDATVYLLLGLMVTGISWFIFLVMGYDPLDALFEVVSATGTVGLSVGVTGPQLPALLKGVLCADMLMGRLEFVAFIILLSPRTWLGKRRRTT